ncbi:MAG: polyphosphate polymerase domain-containing protein [Lachnospiraceae bacterium]|nr:polyphosphate polymerase domain-containing protein [Lachnospiraceae bacterium]
MEKNDKYRHELKYQIGTADYYAIRQRLRPVMKSDEHVREDGRYVIRSIYFDNADDKVLLEKVNGVQKREKFRVRFYNDDFSYVKLEKKIKWNSLCMKIDARLTEEECRALIAGDTAWMMKHPYGLVRELYCKMNSQQLRPKVMVSYVREPYIYKVGNVRVTFDSNIRSTLFHRAFLKETAADIAVADNPGEIILEVKFDAFLPELIQLLIQTAGIRRQAYSKYGVCRRFG